MFARLSTTALGWMLIGSAARALIRGLGRFDAADELGDRGCPALAEVLVEPCVHLLWRERVIEERGAEPHGRRAREHELERVVRGLDTALADDRDAALAALAVDLIHLEQRDRLDRRAGEPALDVADDRPARLDVDRHAHQGVDDRE